MWTRERGEEQCGRESVVREDQKMEIVEATMRLDKTDPSKRVDTLSIITYTSLSRGNSTRFRHLDSLQKKLE